MNLGSILRDERKKRKLTLKAVSEKAGISEGFLSQVENDANSPSVSTLISICNALGIKAGDVLKQVEKQELLVTIRSGEWKDVEFPASGFVTQRFFSPENRRIIDSSVIAIEPGASIPARKNVKNTQEVLCVLKGAVELSHGGKVIRLEEGDSVHYWSIQQKETISNRTTGCAVVLWVGTL
ncbi:MAG TPA: XRE family transcriptional regulator [Syntrophales bacterium]|nr:XRE family transcriptional regulator [Syntrophales bacterium]HPQ45431.1 XRE family transcriptional regulator [Syntrophales bacterium]